MQLEKFLQLVKQDPTLQEQLRKATDEEAGVKLWCCWNWVRSFG
ncbi:MAG TPA: hypothetical protein DCF68_13955 [Cyanothece sp. UBA12306]|nr:hypothetical protein [Cyanothece sp. UBA12306]